MRVSSFGRYVILLATLFLLPSAPLRAQSGGAIVEQSGATGGLVVHIGCGDGKLTVQLRATDRYTVQGLSAGDVSAAQKHIRTRGLHGPVSVRQWQGPSLPYAADLVNLIVVSSGGIKTDTREIARVLAPGGTAMVRGEIKMPATLKESAASGIEGWRKFTKAWPSDIDQWTHYLHGPDNNAVAQDTRIRPLNSIRWKCGPTWCRSHEYNSNIAAMVSGEGRLFYIRDKGLRGIIQIYEKNRRFPSRWALFGRDAFNGMKLWERKMEDWGPAEWNNYGFRSNPLVLPRRLVAVGDKVYVTLSYRGAMSILDAATGKTLKVCSETADAHEIIAADGVVVLRVREKRKGTETPRWVDVPEYVMAVDGEKGQTLWKNKVGGSLVPLSLAMGSGKVCYHDFKHVVCLDRKTGRELWRTPSLERSAPRDPGNNRFRKGNSGILVIYKGVVLFSAKDGLEAFSLESGKKLWVGPKVISVAPSNCFVTTGLFCAQGAVWPMIEPGAMSQRDSYAKFKGYDPQTGEVTKKIDVSHLLSQGHHVRCYPAKATERYLLLPKRGTEFLDLAGDNHMRHDWIRGVCAYGVMPANGLVYVPTHQCFCYPGVTLKGFNALCAASEKVEGADAGPLERGAAFTKVRGTGFAVPATGWPMYRRDILRSGSTSGKVPTAPTVLWEAKLSGALTQPVVFADRLIVAQKDSHVVHCLDVTKGKALWSFAAGGRIDSSPTIAAPEEGKGDALCLFGCRDGLVYCLRLFDGAMVWKFRAAPAERQIVAFQRLESAWPANGSVIVQNGIAYVTAGRSTLLDGGIRVWGLDVATGKVVHRNCVASERPDVRKNPGRPFDMDGSLSDMLTSDGTDLYMYQVRLKADLTVQDSPRTTSLGARKMGLHLMSTRGFVDSTWYDRTYWSYSRQWPGFYFSDLGPKSGQILVFDEKATYGLKVFLKHEGPWWGGGHSPFFIPEQMKYELFADDNDNEPVLKQPDREKGPGYTRKKPARWKKPIDVRVMGMVLVGDKLVAAGPPNVVPTTDPFAAFEGRKGSRLCVFSAADGKKLSEQKLDCVPVFDGLVFASSRLYMATASGRIVCFGSP